MIHLNEVLPGKGALHYPTLLQLLHMLNPDMPLIIEHLASEAEYRMAANYIRKVAEEESIPL